MIVVCGITSDPSTALVIAALDRLGHTHAVLHQRRFEETPIDAQIVGAQIEGQVLTGLGPVDCASVTGIYSRFMDWTVLPEVCDGPEETVERCRTWHHALSNWIEIAPGCVMNRAGASASNQSKPYQTQLIRQAGFQIPETLVTNDPELVHDFRARHGLLIYKSISSVRSIVQVLNDDADARLPLIRGCPVQFQRLIPGTNVRVHVAAGAVFATRVVTNGLDYRYADRTEFLPWQPPDELAERCSVLADRLGLPLAGIDLILTDDGQVFCLEVNPNPAFGCYENRTGQPISNAIAVGLERGRRSWRTPQDEGEVLAGDPTTTIPR
ncbi:hypothetical protein BJ965_006994 [Streptomyces luteogriseus]|uniref:ATP-grasp domain-containing protein n=1 Tax=Streptomyces luteogriseus TaxID=68233 RepID=A0A7W7DUT4_9ACTN|nr:glutathione synthase [Streptomyces luteogriseus]MBB4717112.1 hypothetical protein [Streptomyces luteogriseus]